MEGQLLTDRTLQEMIMGDGQDRMMKMCARQLCGSLEYNCLLRYHCSTVLLVPAEHYCGDVFALLDLGALGTPKGPNVPETSD
jgi:hypothetical protein